MFEVAGNKIINVNFSGNMFVTIDGQTKEVLYDEAIAFSGVLSDIILKQYQKYGANNLLMGEVMSVSVEDDGETRRRICIIDTNNNKIDITHSYIYNTITKEGWSNLKKGDFVDIYLQKNSEKAEAIFITENKEK